MSVRIVIDSTADLKESLQGRFPVVPLSIQFGDESFIDGVTINHEQFYEKLVNGDVMPSTSQPTPDAFAQVYQQAMDAGDEVVVITVSSSLSGTYQSATIAAMDFPADKIFIVDSQSVAIGAGILAEHALQMIENGMGAAEVAAVLNEEKSKIHLIAVLDTLEYLKKGGRISKTVAFAGGLLNLKPVICIEGEVKMLGTARGSKQSFSTLDEKIRECGEVDFDRPVLLGYTGNDDSQLRKYLEKTGIWNGMEPATTIIGSTVGTHAGPGAVAVAFFVK